MALGPQSVKQPRPVPSVCLSHPAIFWQAMFLTSHDENLWWNIAYNTAVTENEITNHSVDSQETLHTSPSRVSIVQEYDNINCWYEL